MPFALSIRRQSYAVLVLALAHGLSHLFQSIAECRSLSSLQSSRCQEAVQKATSHLRRMISEQGISLHELFEEIAGIVQQRVLPFRKLIDLVNMIDPCLEQT